MDRWIGIDVSKDTLDVTFFDALGKPKHRVVANSLKGFMQLVRWAEAGAEGKVRYAAESSGNHQYALAVYLSDRQRHISVLNPRRLHHFAIAADRKNKTDKMDAKMIAQFAAFANPSRWPLWAKYRREFTELTRRLGQLADMERQEENRRGNPALSKAVHASHRRMIAFLTKETNLILKCIAEAIDANETLRAEQALLVTIPGMGKATACVVQAELGDVAEFPRATQAAAYAGLSPCQRQSGTSVRGKTQIARGGNARLRAALYFPALSAKRHNPRVRALAERLEAKGMCKKAITIACMRKLLMICYGVLRSGRPFEATNT